MVLTINPNISPHLSFVYEGRGQGGQTWQDLGDADDEDEDDDDYDDT